MYYYIDHLYGRLYSSYEELEYDDLYCEECGDCDTFLGYFETSEDADRAYAEYLGFDSYEDYKKEVVWD